MTLFAVALPAGVAAQDAAQNATAKHHHYKLIDLGTLGGPQSVIYETANRALNKGGTVVDNSDTSNFDPNNPQNPSFLYPDGYLDPYIQHAVQWSDGKRTDLGALPGGTSSYMQWINDRGMVVGGSTNGVIDPLTGYPETMATLWNDGKVYNLGTFGGNESGAYSLSNLGQVVGWASNTIPDAFAWVVFAQGATQAHAALWKNGVIEDLGTLGGPDSSAVFINERGQIAGESLTSFIPNSWTGYPTQDPFLWENGQMTDLGTLGGTNGSPYALNNRGQVVGISNLAGDQNWHAFLWERGVLKDLGTLGGPDIFSYATAINEAGEVAGVSAVPGAPVWHPFLWKNGTMYDLGTAGTPCGYAIGINSPGQVVGASYDCIFGGYSAFLWEHGSIVDLNTLIPPGSDLHLGQAININDRGEIVGTALLPGGDPQFYSKGYLHAFLLIPCDENHGDVEGCNYSLVDVAAAPTNLPPGKDLRGAQHMPHWRRINSH